MLEGGDQITLAKHNRQGLILLRSIGDLAVGQTQSVIQGDARTLFNFHF